MASTFLTQLNPITPHVAPLNYKWLEGEWPVLDEAKPVPPNVFNRIRSNGTGSAITSEIGFFTLGIFYITPDLLEPHPTQRPINHNHVTVIIRDFQSLGIHRLEEPGVVIGLGDGWLKMKNNGEVPYMITPSSPHLNLLSSTHGGPIGQIIRGGHRSAAIKRFSRSEQEHMSQNFWAYKVLLPGQFLPQSVMSFSFMLSSVLSHQHSSLCSSS
jgi:hypothetical protein